MIRFTDMSAPTFCALQQNRLVYSRRFELFLKVISLIFPLGADRRPATASGINL